MLHVYTHEGLQLVLHVRLPIERGMRQVLLPSFTFENPMLSLVTALVSIKHRGIDDTCIKRANNKALKVRSQDWISSIQFCLALLLSSSKD